MEFVKIRAFEALFTLCIPVNKNTPEQRTWWVRLLRKLQTLGDTTPSKLRTLHKYTRLFLFQGPIGHEVKTAVKIPLSVMQMCCAIPLVWPSVASDRTC